MSNRQRIVNPDKIITIPAPRMQPRPYANLCIAPKACARMLESAPEHQPAAEGYSNTATWAFSLYFMQEPANHAAIVALIRRTKTGKPTDNTYREAQRIMNNAYNLSGGLSMEPLDGDETGMVNVREIVDDLASELGRNFGPCPGHDANTDCQNDPDNPCDACNATQDAKERQ